MKKNLYEPVKIGIVAGWGACGKPSESSGSLQPHLYSASTPSETRFVALPAPPLYQKRNCVAALPA
jgi:hypothetical protein